MRKIHAAEEKRKEQPTVISGCLSHCSMVTITLRKNQLPLDVVQAAAKLQEIVKKLSKGNPDLLIAGVGFDTRKWEDFKDKKNLPEGMGHYKSRYGEHGNLPYSGGDLILHVKGDTYSLCYETVQEFVKSLPKNSVDTVEDFYGFQFQDGRDLSGFLDGTENTNGDEERSSAGINSQNGSFLIHQRWEHNLQKLNKETVETQEGWVGRKKNNSQELPKETMPKESHVARMRNEKFERIPIVRQSMPFHSSHNKNGLLFIAYSSNVKKFDEMLDRMTGDTKDKLNDSIMRYSRCVTGNYWYFPSIDELEKLSK